MTELRQRWNERHAGAAGPAERPAPWLVRQRDLLEQTRRGRALDLACGRGRNALLLAELGFEVDAIDISDVAVETVLAEARERGLPVRAWRADLSGGAMPAGPYDAIVVVDYLDRSLFAPMQEALAPGGLLVLTTFTHDHPTMNRAYTVAPDELLGAFPDLRVLRYEEAAGRALLTARRP